MKLPRFRSHKTHTLQNSSASEKETNNTYKKIKISFTTPIPAGAELSQGYIDKCVFMIL